MPKEDYTQQFVFGNSEQRLPSAFISAGTQILWQWNETDVTQFGSTYFMNSTRTAALNITAATISAPGAAGGVGPRVRFTFTMVAGSGGAFIWPIYGTNGSHLAIPNRFKARYRIAMANNMKVGLCVHNGNESTPFAFGAAQLPSSNSSETNWARTGIVGGETPWESVANTPINARSPNNTTGNPAVGTYYEDFIQYDIATASTPPYPMYGHFAVYGQGSGVNTVNLATPEQLTGSPPNAAWTGRTDLQYLGILFITNRGTGTSATVELADIQVVNSNMSAGGY